MMLTWRTRIQFWEGRLGILRILTAVALFGLCYASNLEAQQGNSDSAKLFSIRISGKYGFIRSDGTVAIQPSFDRVNEFTENRAYVEKDGRHFFIDQDGGEVFAVNGLAVPFSQGLSLYQDTRTGMYGFLDQHGIVAIRAHFLSASNFSGGLAAVKVAKDRSLYIKRNGEYAFPGIEFASCGDFHNGFAVVGKKVEEPQYVQLPNSKATKLTTGIRFGVIDSQGKLVVPFSYIKLGDCEENGLFRFLDGKNELDLSGNSGYVDKSGKVVIPAQFEETGKFSEGLLPVKKRGKGLFGAIDSTGTVVLGDRYLELRNFSNSLAGFSRTRGKFGFVDKSGTVAIEEKYDFVGDFNNGLAYVRVGDQEGYVSPDGREYLSGDYIK